MTTEHVTDNITKMGTEYRAFCSCGTTTRDTVRALAAQRLREHRAKALGRYLTTIDDFPT